MQLNLRTTGLPLLRNIDFRTQTRNVWKNNRFLIVILLLTVFADFLSTIGFMHLVGIELEQNYLVKLLALNLGIIMGTLIGKGAQVFSVWGFSMLSPRLATFIIAGLALINIFAVHLNMRVVHYALDALA